ncbi:alanyl-tRNA synthetase, partial [Achromatium sp. WMS1]
ASQFGIMAQATQLEMEGQTDFTGYQRVTENATILALFSDGISKETLEPGSQGMVILDRTPFYAESGGQVGDKGLITTSTAEFAVIDTKKQSSTIIGHLGHVRNGSLQVGDLVEAIVDKQLRFATALNHSATHLLHAALRRILGEHVVQKGSLVDSERLRFDFAHATPVTPDQLRQIERLVNQEIRANHLVETRIMSLEDAKAMGAMALFGEKYSNQVRVLCMGGFSTELCGGTHVNAVGNIGLFKITQETGVAAGVRRIEAVTGSKAIDVMEAESERLQRLSALVRSDRDDVEQRVNQLLEQMRSLEKELNQLKTKLASTASANLVDQAQEIAGIKVLAVKLEENTDPKTLPKTMDNLKDRLNPAVIVLATITDGKVNLIVGITKELTNKAKAGDLIRVLAEHVGAKGGGRPDMARAGGGNNPDGLLKALALVAPWVTEKFGN